MKSEAVVSCGHRAGKATARAQARIEIIEAERDGAREAYDRMKVERDAALDALHRVRRALGLGGVLGRPETIAESAERRTTREGASASWQALHDQALDKTKLIVGDDPEHAAECVEVSCCFPSPKALYGLSLFARLMAIVSSPS